MGDAMPLGRGDMAELSHVPVRRWEVPGELQKDGIAVRCIHVLLELVNWNSDLYMLRMAGCSFDVYSSWYLLSTLLYARTTGRALKFSWNCDLPEPLLLPGLLPAAWVYICRSHLSTTPGRCGTMYRNICSRDNLRNTGGFPSGWSSPR